MLTDKQKVETAADTLRLTAAQVDAIIAQLMAKQAQQPKTPNDLRRAARTEYRSEQPIIVTVEQMGGNLTRFAMYPWNLSTTGMAFLHGTFLYKGVKCVVALPKPGAAPVEIPARVMRCRLISGRIHEVGVRFDSSIEVDQFAAKTPETITSSKERPPSWDDPALGPMLEMYVRQLPVCLRQLQPQIGQTSRKQWLSSLEEFAQISKAFCFHNIAQAAMDLFNLANQVEDAQPLAARFAVLRAVCEKTEVP